MCFDFLLFFSLGQLFLVICCTWLHFGFTWLHLAVGVRPRAFGFWLLALASLGPWFLAFWLLGVGFGFSWLLALASPG
jgi:hypothetical protein